MRQRYANLEPRHGPPRWPAVLRWGVLDRLVGRRRIAEPGPPAPRVAPDLDAIQDPSGPPRLTWVGHASFLGQLAGVSVLIDPHFSDRAGFFYRRHGDPGLRLEQLPPLAAVLISHNHYDHLDVRSIDSLPRSVPVLVPDGLGRWFRRKGFEPVVEMQWWEMVDLGPLRITFVPARHWSRRGMGDTNRSWWGGFVIEASGVRFYHAGDSAVSDGFREIGRRFPGIEAAMLPIGSYSPAWFMERVHMNPEQAGEAFREVGARVMVPMHWGTFQLTDEPLSEPADRVLRWWAKNPPGDDRRLWLPKVGETREFD